MACPGTARGHGDSPTQVTANALHEWLSALTLSAHTLRFGGGGKSHSHIFEGHEWRGSCSCHTQSLFYSAPESKILWLPFFFWPHFFGSPPSLLLCHLFFLPLKGVYRFELGWGQGTSSTKGANLSHSSFNGGELEPSNPPPSPKETD